MELADMFPDEASALQWFEARFWPCGRTCGPCGSAHTKEARHAKMPCWCRDCRSYFSIKTGTLLAYTQRPLRKRVFAIHRHRTGLKGISSMQLHRDIGVSQKTAWHMLQRIRQAFDDREDDHGPFGGPVEVDETCVGGQRKNMSNARRKAQTGRGTAGKTAVVGIKDRGPHRVRAAGVATTDTATLEGFVAHNARTGAPVYTDEAAADRGLSDLCYRHESVPHSTGEYVRDTAHTNGMESFRSMLKRGYVGVYHTISPTHLGRHVSEFSGRHNIRRADTRVQMARLVEGMVGQRLRYHGLVADNGLPSGARS